jgi:hypothetical protein
METAAQGTSGDGTGGMEEQVATFVSLTGAPAGTALQLLGVFEGDLERAVNYYLENEAGGGANMTDEDAQLAARLMEESAPALAAAQPSFAGEIIDMLRPVGGR